MPTLPLDPQISGSTARLEKSRAALTKGFDPGQPRDPHTGRWIEWAGHGANGSDVYRVFERDGTKVTSGKNGAFLFGHREATTLSRHKEGSPVEFDVENHGAGSKTGQGTYVRPVGSGATHHEVFTTDGRLATVPSSNLRRRPGLSMAQLDAQDSVQPGSNVSPHQRAQLRTILAADDPSYHSKRVREVMSFRTPTDGSVHMLMNNGVSHVIPEQKPEESSITGASLRSGFSTAQLLAARREAEEHGQAVLSIDGYDEYVSLTLIERALAG